MHNISSWGATDAAGRPLYPGLYRFHAACEGEAHKVLFALIQADPTVSARIRAVPPKDWRERNLEILNEVASLFDPVRLIMGASPRPPARTLSCTSPIPYHV
jgi:hypothetical protein